MEMLSAMTEWICMSLGPIPSNGNFKTVFLWYRVYIAWFLTYDNHKIIRWVNYSNLTIICLYDAAEIQRSACIMIRRQWWQWGQNITFFMSDMCLFQTISCKYKKTDSIITVKIASKVLVILLSYSSNKALEVFQIIFYPVRLKILL